MGDAELGSRRITSRKSRSAWSSSDFLQVGKADVDARHSCWGIGLEDGAELRNAFFGAAGVDEDEAKIVAGVEIRGVEGRLRAAIGVDGTRDVVGVLARQAQADSRLPSVWDWRWWRRSSCGSASRKC